MATSTAKPSWTAREKLPLSQQRCKRKLNARVWTGLTPKVGDKVLLRQEIGDKNKHSQTSHAYESFKVVASNAAEKTIEIFRDDHDENFNVTRMVVTHTPSVPTDQTVMTEDETTCSVRRDLKWLLRREKIANYFEQRVNRLQTLSQDLRDNRRREKIRLNWILSPEGNILTQKHWRSNMKFSNTIVDCRKTFRTKRLSSKREIYHNATKRELLTEIWIKTAIFSF